MSKVCPSARPELPIGVGETTRRQRRVSGWYDRRMWRSALAICLSYQYQRSRNSTASATKNIGMPLASASSITAGQVESDVGGEQQALVGALHVQLRDLGRRAARPATAAQQQQAPSKPPRRAKARRAALRKRVFLQQRVIKTVVITC